MSEKVRYHVERNIWKNYNRKTRHALYNNLKGQWESKETALKPLTEQLRELWLDYSVYDEEYINEHYDRVIIIERIRKLIDRWVLPPDQKAHYHKIQLERLNTINNEKHFQLLSDLNKTWLKMGSNILFDIGDIDICQEQVENFAKYKIKVDNADDLDRDHYYNNHRGRFQGFTDLWYSLNDQDILNIEYNIGSITFSNLKRLNDLLWRRVPIEIVLRDSNDYWLWRCHSMEDFKWDLVQYLTNNGISIPDRQLRRFNYDNSIRKGNFEPLIKNNIKILYDDEIFEKIANISSKGWEISNEDFTKIYWWNHPDEEPQKYKTYIDENVHKKDYFLEAYKRTEEYMQSQNKSS